MLSASFSAGMMTSTFASRQSSAGVARRSVGSAQHSDEAQHRAGTDRRSRDMWPWCWLQLKSKQRSGRANAAASAATTSRRHNGLARRLACRSDVASTGRFWWGPDKLACRLEFIGQREVIDDVLSRSAAAQKLPVTARSSNQRTGVVLAHHLIPAFDSPSRRTGLLQHGALPDGHCHDHRALECHPYVLHEISDRRRVRRPRRTACGRFATRSALANLRRAARLRGDRTARGSIARDPHRRRRHAAGPAVRSKARSQKLAAVVAHETSARLTIFWSGPEHHQCATAPLPARCRAIPHFG